VRLVRGKSASSSVETSGFSSVRPQCLSTSFSGERGTLSISGRSSEA
jgi:hypothetical protein